MKQRNNVMAILAPMLMMSVSVAAQQVAAHFDMSLDNGKISEEVTAAKFDVASQLPAFTSEGIDGEALRFDGYSNYVKAALPTDKLSAETMTLSVLLAAETYPMMKVDVAEEQPTYGTICGNLEGKTGFALQLSSQGDLRFQFGSAYANGYLFAIDGNQKLPRGQWCRVTAVLDKAANTAKLYLNDAEIGSSRMSRADIVHSSAPFFIGKDATDVKSGPFLINTFCGLIDDISISNSPLPASPLGEVSAPDFSYPASRYQSSPQGGTEGGFWRPQFHGMPSGSWTNESHGMLYSGGRYHVFFQKNANGPYMSRLHWGHISSENLYDWREEPIAIAPGEPYDMKGCWSGCVYEDGGTPYILYTAVDNARATIAQAKALDGGLVEWQKQGIIINGRPAGLSDDFRDPYFFELPSFGGAGGGRYVIVGTSKNGVGACTLHKYENGTWSNDGAIFFQGATAREHGTFWEMPNLTPMGDGRWLFTCTPLGTALGVRTLCWVGTIGTDGKFTPLGGQGGAMQYLEMGGISKDGYGLLSPTICQKDGKTLLLGIVPDKLPTQTNYEMGWAHNFSLPREVSLAADGSLVQKPYSGLEGMRTETRFMKSMTLAGSEPLSPVAGRQIELLADFVVANGGSCGFHFLKSGSSQVSLAYDAATGLLSLDMTSLARMANDNGVYNGTYTAALPTKVNAGQRLRLHVFLDGSIADIFVNDTWAYSVRLFPTDAAAVEAEVFATVETQADVRAWVLDARRSGDTAIGSVQCSATGISCLYDLQGRRLRGECMKKKGIYIQDGKKYVSR